MSNILIYISIFILGSIVGSFLNVVILRLNKSSFVSGRSFCPKCGKTLSWFELVPIFSFVFLRGRCSSCFERISIQYPIVELASGILFLSAFLIASSVLEAFYLAIIFSVLVIIFFYDLKNKIILNSFSCAFGALAFSSLFFNFSGYDIVVPFWGDIIAGPLFFIPFFALWFFSSGRWMGLGDAKLSIGIGWFLGLKAGFSSLVISFWLGALVGIALLIIGHFLKKVNLKSKSVFFQKMKNITWKSEIPFGPFLILGALIVLFFNVDILDTISAFLLYN